MTMNGNHKNNTAEDSGRSRQANAADRENRDYDVDIQSCSTTDCTGLIPSLPQDDAEVEHYNQVYRFLPEHLSAPKNRS